MSAIALAWQRAQSSGWTKTIDTEGTFRQLTRRRFAFNEAIPRQKGKRRKGLLNANDMCLMRTIVELAEVKMQELEKSSPKAFCIVRKYAETDGIQIKTSMAQIAYHAGLITNDTETDSADYRNAINQVSRSLSRLTDASVKQAQNAKGTFYRAHLNHFRQRSKGRVDNFLWDHQDGIRAHYKAIQQKKTSTLPIGEKPSLYLRISPNWLVLRNINLKTQVTDNQHLNRENNTKLPPYITLLEPINKVIKENGINEQIQSPIGDKTIESERDKLINPPLCENVENGKGRQIRKVGDLIEKATFKEKEDAKPTDNQSVTNLSAKGRQVAKVADLSLKQPKQNKQRIYPQISKKADALEQAKHDVWLHVLTCFPHVQPTFGRHKLGLKLCERYLKRMRIQRGHDLPNWKAYGLKIKELTTQFFDNCKRMNFEYRYTPFQFLDLRKDRKTGQYIMRTACLRHFEEELLPHYLKAKQSVHFNQSLRLINAAIVEDMIEGVLIHKFHELHAAKKQEMRATQRDHRWLHKQLMKPFLQMKANIELQFKQIGNDITDQQRKTILAEFSRTTFEAVRRDDLREMVELWLSESLQELHIVFIERDFSYTKSAVDQRLAFWLKRLDTMKQSKIYKPEEIEAVREYLSKAVQKLIQYYTM